MTGERHTEESTLLATVYERLRGMAARHLAAERSDHTLQPTALVHEAWLALRSQLAEIEHEPARFFGAAAEAMRRILIDHARRRGAQKRGGVRARVPIDLVDLAATASLHELQELDDAIAALAEQSPRSAEVVRLRFFAGLGEAELGNLLGMSERTVRREWAFARAFLWQRLYGGSHE